MAQAKVLKPGMVVFDIDQNEYVIFKGYSADHKDQAFVHNPRCGEDYRTKFRPLTRRELGLP